MRVLYQKHIPRNRNPFPFERVFAYLLVFSLFIVSLAGTAQASHTITELSQFRNDNTLQILLGGATEETAVVFRASITNPTSDNVLLQVELRPVGTSFTCTNASSIVDACISATSGPSFISRSNQVGVRSSVLGFGAYHWQARTVDPATGAAGDWVSFRGNDEAGPDFTRSTYRSLYLLPSGLDASSSTKWSFTGSPSLDLDSPDGDGSYATGTAFGEKLVMEIDPIPSGQIGTIHAVRVIAQVRNEGNAQSSFFKVGLQVNGSSYSGPLYETTVEYLLYGTVTGSYNYTFTPYLNPETGLPWQWVDLANLSPFIEKIDSLPLRVSYLAVVVDYSPVELSYSVDRGYGTDGIDPQGGAGATVFTYRVVYKHQDGAAPPPGSLKVHIDGDSGHDMVLASGGTDYLSGEEFTYVQALAPGDHDYYFSFENNGLPSGAESGNDLAVHPFSGPLIGPVVSDTSPFLALSQEIGYQSDGVSPDAGGTSTLFTYKIIYFHNNNLPPASVSVQIDGGPDNAMAPNISASSELNDGNYINGEQYFFTTTLGVGGHTHSFKAFDGTTPSALQVFPGPIVSDLPPVLSFSSDPGYDGTDGVDPDAGATGTLFTFKVIYTDPGNLSPAFVKVHLDNDPTGFFMVSDTAAVDAALRDGNYSNGEQYTITLGATNQFLLAGNHRYHFSGSNGATPAQDFPIPDASGPVVSSIRPRLSYSQELNYQIVGISPTGGAPNTTIFTYKIIYTDRDNNPPTFVDVLIDGGVGTAMSLDTAAVDASLRDGNYSNGEQYVVATSFVLDTNDPPVNSHSYQFSASDGANNVTFPASTISLPVISANVPFLNNEVVTPSTGDTLNDPFTFQVDYSDADNNSPTSVKVWIDLRGNGTEPNPQWVDLVMTKGAGTDFRNPITYSIGPLHLPPGNSAYYFTAFDGVDTTRLPPSGNLSVTVTTDQTATGGRFSDTLLLRPQGKVFLSSAAWVFTGSVSTALDTNDGDISFARSAAGTQTILQMLFDPAPFARVSDRINAVRLWAVVRDEYGTSSFQLRICQQQLGCGSATTLSTSGRNEYGTYVGERMTTNPMNSGAPWTWGDVNRLVGQLQKALSTDGLALTELFVTVEYSVLPVLQLVPQLGYSIDIPPDGVNPNAGMPSTSPSATTFTYKVNYFHGLNVPPSTINVQNNIGTFTLVRSTDPASPDFSDGDYANGEEYSLTTTLGAGLYSHSFSTSVTTFADTYTTNSVRMTPDTSQSSFSGPVVTSGTPTLAFSAETGYQPDAPNAILTGTQGVDPNTGDSLASSFTFKVVYTDPDNLPPDTPGFIRLHLDGDTAGIALGADISAVAALQDGNYANGEQYSYTTGAGELTPGLHSYVFQASNGLNSARLPAAAVLYSPQVTGPYRLHPSGKNSATSSDWNPTPPLLDLQTALSSNNGNTSSFNSAGTFSTTTPNAGQLHMDMEDPDRAIGTISSVKVSAYIRCSIAFDLGIKVGSAEIFSNETCNSTAAFTLFTAAFPTNPLGNAWSWDDIQEMIGRIRNKAGGTQVTEFFVDINFTSLPTLTYSAETGYSGSDGLDPNFGSPIGSTSPTLYTYKVVYTHELNTAPIAVLVNIDGGAGIAMSMDTTADPTLRDGDYTNGEQYFYQTSLDIPGTSPHYYTFEASDGTTTLQTGLLFGPTVSSGPTSLSLSYSPAAGYNSVDGVSPKTGMSWSTPFTYKVIYKDADGNAPTSVRVHIDGDVAGLLMLPESPITTTTNFSADVAYQITMTLASGTHTYYFGASNGAFNTLLPDNGSLRADPIVADSSPPNAVSDLVILSGSQRPDSFTLNWTASGDDGACPSCGSVSQYIIKYSTKIIIDDTALLTPGSIHWSSITNSNPETDPYEVMITIPGSSLSPESTESYTITGLVSNTAYSIALQSRDPSGNLSPLSNVINGTSYPLDATISAVDPALPVTSLLRDNNMISLPLIPQPPDDPESIFGDDVQSFRLYEYKGGCFNGYPAPLPPCTEAIVSVVPGTGYFLTSPNTTSVVDVLGGLVSSTVEITLEPGINLVGNPYSRNLLLSSILVCQTDTDPTCSSPATYSDAVLSGWVSNVIYLWTGDVYTYERFDGVGTPVATLRPWKGYWLKVLDETNNYKLILSPP